MQLALGAMVSKLALGCMTLAICPPIAVQSASVRMSLMPGRLAGLAPAPRRNGLIVPVPVWKLELKVWKEPGCEPAIPNVCVGEMDRPGLMLNGWFEKSRSVISIESSWLCDAEMRRLPVSPTQPV